MTESSSSQNRQLPSWVNVLRTVIDISPKAAVTAGALCYGLGILIVSSHLARLGVYTTDFLRAEYILVGAAFCILTFCAAVASHYFVVFVQDSADLWKQKKYRAAALAFFFTIAGSVVAFSRLLQLIATDNLGSLYNWRTWLALAVAILAYTTIRNTWRIARLAWVTTFEQKDRKATTRHAWNVVFDLASLIATIGLYTSFVYPHLRAEYGGGHRQAVVLIPTASGQRVARTAGLPFRPDGTIGPVRLLLENDQALTVTTIDDERAVSISRDLVEAVAEYRPSDTYPKSLNMKLGAVEPPASPDRPPRTATTKPVTAPRPY